MHDSTLRQSSEEDEDRKRHFTVTFVVGVNAESPQQAAQFALDDLRDTSLVGPWVAVVKTGIYTWTEYVESAGETS
jgi:hypothetical protein